VNNVQRQRLKNRPVDDAKHFIECKSDRDGLVKMYINDNIGMCLDFI